MHQNPRKGRMRVALVFALALLVAALGALSVSTPAHAGVPIVDPLIEPVLDAAILPGAPAHACGSGDWAGPADGCKYAKAKVGTTCVNNCESVDINNVKWRGGTASGTCDPTNDITQWRLRWIRIVRTTDNAVRWSRGASGWHTNCDVDANTYTEFPNLRVGVDHIVKYKWEHVTACCGPFFPRVDLLVAAR